MDMHNLTEEEKKTQRQHHLRSEFPYSYDISLGEWPCNNRCRMCPAFSNPVKKKRFISDEVLERACREFGDRDTQLEVSAMGETFLHPKADEYLFTMRRLCPNAKIIVATNGTLLDRERCEKIVDSGIDVLQFSLNAGSAESYKWLTGRDDYERLCKNLETLAEVKRERNATHLHTFTHIIGIKELAHEFDSFLERWRGIVTTVHVRNFGNWAGTVDENQVTPAEHQNIPEERYPCAWPFFASKVQPDGSVAKCFIHCLDGDDSESLGNIMEQSYESIWKGEKIQRVRQAMLENKADKLLKYCKNCIVWSLFPKFWDKEKDGSWS